MPDVTASEVELTVVLPCLDEAKTVATCVRQAIDTCRRHNIAAEVIVADNGSRDGSRELAAEAGARVVEVPVRGYGAALRAGIEAARGALVVMGDADDSYDFGDIPKFVGRLRAGDELVMGTRLRGTIHPGAMPFINRYFGTPFLTTLVNLFFRSRVSDVQCGLRGFSRAAVLGLRLQTNGMEFASEMVIRAAQERLRISEVPTSLRPDGRGRPPHMRRWRDGWRNLRFMLLHTPLWLFLVPGLCATVAGVALSVLVALAPPTVAGHRLNTHFALLGSLFAVLGLEVVSLALFAKAVFVLDGMGHAPRLKRFIEGFRLEIALIVGGLLFLLGLGADGWVLSVWIGRDFGTLESHITHIAIAGCTMCVTGVQIVFAGFFLTILRASRTRCWV